jgi:hypothetical protein
MPTAAGAKGYIVLSAPTDSINDILDVLTKDDCEGERRELSGPEETSALIVRAIGKNQTTREFTPTGSELILHFGALPLPRFLPAVAAILTTIHRSGRFRYLPKRTFLTFAKTAKLFA